MHIWFLGAGLSSRKQSLYAKKTHSKFGRRELHIWIKQGNAERFLSKLSDEVPGFGVISLRIEDPGGNPPRVEWIYGLHNNNDKSSVYTCLAYHLMGSLNVQNIQQVFFSAAKYVTESDNSHILNANDPFLHYSIDIDEFLEQNFPSVKRTSKLSESLIDISKIRSVLKWEPVPSNNTYLDGMRVLQHYRTFKYYEKAGQP